MAGVQLYNGLIKATEQIVTKFGKDILTEERFVNILHDLYPDRDNPAVFRIIKSVINENIAEEMLSSNKEFIGSTISISVKLLSQKYGYDSLLVEGILYSVSIGAGVITLQEYNKIAAPKKIPPQNNPPKKQTPPPTKKKTNNSPTKSEPVGAKYIFGLILGLIGLIVSPLAYLGWMSKGWWPLGCTIVMACIHLFTIVGMAAIIGDSGKSHRYPYIAGASNAVLFFAIVFWLAFPFVCGIDSFLAYFGIYNKDSFPWLITILANLFCAMILTVYFPEINNAISGINTSHCKTFIEKAEVLFASSPYRKGFFMVCAIALLEAIFIWSIPQYKKWQWEKEMETFNDGIENINREIEGINHHKDSLRNERCKQLRQLAFADFQLGTEYSNCLSVVNSKEDYEKMDSYIPTHLKVNGIDYSSIIGQNLKIKTNWNNELLVVNLYFSRQKLILLEFYPRKTNNDSIIAIYTNKYGEPEYKLNPIGMSDYRYYAYNNIDFLKENSLKTDTCRWTFKNGILEIIKDKSNSSYNYENSSTIKYFDRVAESYLQEKISEDKRLQQIAEQHRSDSLKKVREELERQRKEQREREELNHQRYINQI